MGLSFAFSQESSENTEEFVDVTSTLGTGSVDFTWLFLKTLLAMVVVLALAILILRFVLPRLSFHRSHGKGGQIQILERFPLDAKKSLYVIQIKDRQFLLGGSEHTLGLISELGNRIQDTKTS